MLNKRVYKIVKQLKDEGVTFENNDDCIDIIKKALIKQDKITRNAIASELNNWHPDKLSRLAPNIAIGCKDGIK